MTFWIISAAMAALVAGLIVRAMLRGADAPLPDQSDYDLRIYRDQLAEVDRDVARGVVAEADATRVRTEISRRILAADATQRQAAGRGVRPSAILLGAFAGVLLVGSLGLYYMLGQPGYGDLALADRIAFAEQLRKKRPDQQTAEAGMPKAPSTDAQTEQYLSLVAQLRKTVAARPDDMQGHLLLAQNEARLGNFSDAAKAQETVLKLKGAKVTPGDLGDYAELLVLAAGGYVSPEAETAFRAVLAQDAEDGRARYYMGLMMVQTGRPDIGFRLWDRLLRAGPADAPWIEPIRGQIMPVATLAGVDYSLPEIGNGAVAKGPSTADIEAAAEMDTEARMEMIGGMVAGLSDRLASEGGPPQDWARLISSYGVLGNTVQALAIYENALEVFAGDAGAIDMIRAAGERAGVAE
tara:strand:+ start:16970 stop:18199 length:1230 start_codon:yes stop_codon:yes gene_type:complete